MDILYFLPTCPILPCVRFEGFPCMILRLIGQDIQARHHRLGSLKQGRSCSAGASTGGNSAVMWRRTRLSTGGELLAPAAFRGHVQKSVRVSLLPLRLLTGEIQSSDHKLCRLGVAKPEECTQVNEENCKRYNVQVRLFLASAVAPHFILQC